MSGDAKTAQRPIAITRWTTATAATTAHDEVAVEEPLELRVEGRSVAVTMRTPGHDSELAIGFLLTEGVIASAADLLEVNQCPRTAGEEGNVVDILLRQPERVDFERLTRHVFSASSCGLCGKASIEAVQQRFPPLPELATITADRLLALPAQLEGSQSAFHRTGGLHAAALFNATGHLLVVREDVGRHNAVDKVLGWAARSSAAPGEQAIGLMVSGRISFEIVQKALAARLGVVAGISAPTSLAVEFARANRQVLAGFVREGRLNLYAGSLAEE